MFTYQKKLLFTLISLILSFELYGKEIKIRVRAKEGALTYNEEIQEKEEIKQNSSFEIKGFDFIRYEKPDYDFLSYDSDLRYNFFEKGYPILYTENNENICIDNIIPLNCKNLFPEKYISNGMYDNDKVYITENSLNAFFYKNKEIIKKDNLNKFFDDKDYFFVGEYLKGNMDAYPILCNTVITFFTLENFLIKDIRKIDENIYTLDCLYGGNLNDSYETDYDCHSIWLFERFYNYEYISHGDSIKIKVIFDGDYVSFYDMEQNRLLAIHVLVDKNTALACADFFQDKMINFSEIIWPHHADGSCDYDDSKITETSQSIKVSPNKLMSTNCNLKLRSSEATSSSVITVMSQGTRVKVLELGNKETIDGLTSSWVKVEVTEDAKDKDGKPIKKGTVGWCYGGYLEDK